MDLLAALTLGVFGSMHCIGMCGPLVLAVPGNTASRWKYIVERLVYHTGRAMMYGVIGSVLGLVGKGVLINIQQDVSIILGVTILVAALIPLGLRARMDKYSPLKKIHNAVAARFSSLLKKRGYVTLFTLGMLNALLPCGLVYTAVIGAAVVADVWQSALFMFVFGMGTAPALVIVSLTGSMVSQKYRLYITRAIPLFSIALGVILILRGLNLGIPMVSPKVIHQSVQADSIDCCKE